VLWLVHAAGRLGPCAAGGLSLCGERHGDNQRDCGPYGIRGIAGRLPGLRCFLFVVSGRILPDAAAYCPLRGRADSQKKGARMIDSLAIALGLGTQDPAFWMPLIFMGLFFAIIVAGTVLDGFDVGVGCLALFAPAELRPRMLSLLSPWRDANEFWLFLGLGLRSEEHTS